MQAAEPQRYPVAVEIEEVEGPHNRLTCGFRAILAIPHLVIVGAPGAVSAGFSLFSDFDFQTNTSVNLGSYGALASAAALSSIFLWFALIFGARAPAGLRGLETFYLGWRLRGLAYMSLLRDEFPPLGPGEYPAGISINEPAMDQRRQFSIFFRIILALPHLIVLVFVNLLWLLLLIASWFAIVFTGLYPKALRDYSMGAIRWNLRVESYVLLLVDDYPPFGFRR